MRRYDYWDGTEFDEVLSLDKDAVRLERLNLGAPFLNSHCSYGLENVIGSVVPDSARIDDGRGVCRVLLSRAESSKDIVQNIRDGVIRNISVGYWVHKVVKTEADDGAVARWDVVDWEPLEVSAVPIPADPGSQIRSAEPKSGEGPQTRSCEIVTKTPATAPAPQALRSKPMATAKPKTSAKRGAKTPAEMTEEERVLAQLNAAERAAARAGGQRDADEDEDEDENAERDGGGEDEKRDGDDAEEPKDEDESDGERDGDDADEEDDAEDEDEKRAPAAPVAKRGKAALSEAAARKLAQDAVKADRARASEIRKMAREAGMPNLGQKHVDEGTSTRKFGSILLGRLLKKQGEQRNATSAQTGTRELEERPLHAPDDTHGVQKGADEARALLGKKAA